MRSRIWHIVPATFICICVQLFTLTVNGANLQIKPNNLPCAQVGVAFLVMLSVNNGAAPYSYAMAPGTSLPAGLTISSTGAISGTPTAAGPYNFTVQVTDAKSNTGSRAYQGTVNPQLVISTASLPNGSVGAAYNSTLTAAGGTAPYTWSAGAWVGGGAIPTGLSLTSAGVLSGTPTAAGSFSFVLQVTDSIGANSTHAFTVSIAPQLSITTATVPNGTVGSGYSAILGATGGTAPYTWSIASGGLPAGLSLGATGSISGTPTTAGNYTFSVTATDSAGLKALCSYSMAIVAPVSVSVSPTSASVPVAQTQQFSATVSGTSNTGVSWTVNGVAGGNSTVGTVSTSGLYAAPQTVPSSTVTVAAVSAADTTKLGKAPVTVLAAVSVSISPTTASLQVGQNQQFSATVSGTSNTGVTWNVNGIAGGNSTVGTVSTSGLYTAPSTAPTSPVTVAAISVADTTKSAQAAVTVISGLAITTTALPNGNQGVAYSATLSATGGTAPYSWSILSGLLPQGISLTTTTGAISGTPTTSGTYNVAVQVTDAAGHQSSKSFSVVIAAALTITTTTLPSGTVGVAYSATFAATGGCTSSSYVWSVSSGQLPPGLTVSTSGSLSGLPTTAGSYSFGIQVMDCSGAVVQKSCTVTVSNPASTGSTLTITTADLPNGTLGAAYAATMAATGGTPPYTWTLSTGALPAGLTLNSSTGAVSGTPNVVGWSNLFGIQAQDATGATTSLSYSFIVKPATDQYGGFLAQTCTATGVFHTQKINNRWWFCTPAGHVYWNLSVGAIGGQDGSGADTRTGVSFNLARTNTDKYGDITYNWAVAQNNRLTLWGFNGIGQMSSAYVKPMATGFSGGDGTQPVKLPMTDTLEVSTYAGVNLWGYGTRPIKNLAHGYSDKNRIWIGSGKSIMDYNDPAFHTYVNAYLAHDATVQSYKTSPYVLGLFLDDTDWSWGFGAGPEFPTQPSLAHNNSAPAYEVIVTSPVQRFQPNPAYATMGVMYSDGRVFSKVAMSSPPATCSITTPCSLRDYLYTKYSGSIAALNSAWGSNYTTFDSSGSTYTGVQIGTGNGSTTAFSFNLPNTPVSPYSIAVYVNGIQVGGDCPYYNPGCNSVTNAGSFMSPQGLWAPGDVYAQTYIIDSNGNLEQAQNNGNNGSIQPIWNRTQGGTTVAGDVTWKNLGPSIKSGSVGPWAQDGELSGADCATCGLPPASYWFQTTWHGIVSAPSRQIGATFSGAPQITITTQNNASDAPLGVNSVDIYVSCRVLNGPANHGCVASTDPQPAPTLQASGVPYPLGSWTEPTTGLIAGAALPLPPSAITYTSGSGSISFNVSPATGAAITIDYIANGWPYGTGLMDEDGRNTSWLGTNDVCLTPHILVCGPGLSFSAPNANPRTGADLEAWNAQFAAAYFSQSKAAMSAQLPGVLYFGTDTLGTWGAPPPQGVLQGAGPYIDAMFTTVYPGQTYSDAIYQFITQYLGDKPIMNFLTEQSTQDSFLWAYGAQSGQVVAATTQSQRGQNWYTAINAMLTAISYNGTYQWVGANWWALYDFWSEKTNWGLVSLYDNPYDGKSSCQQMRVDVWGYPTGGESPANNAQCFGTAIDFVKQGNSLPYTMVGK